MKRHTLRDYKRDMDAKYFENLRNEARNFNEKRNDYFKSAKEAYRVGDFVKAENDSTLMEFFTRQRDEYDNLAAEAIFRHFNDKMELGITTIDLHRLFVNEAMDKLAERIHSAKSVGEHELVVITGRGLHSKTGAKLKPEVIRFAEDNGIPYKIDEHNLGRVRLSLENLPSESKANGLKRKTAIPENVAAPVPKKTRRKKKTYISVNSLDAIIPFLKNKENRPPTAVPATQTKRMARRRQAGSRKSKNSMATTTSNEQAEKNEMLNEPTNNADIFCHEIHIDESIEVPASPADEVHHESRHDETSIVCLDDSELQVEEINQIETCDSETYRFLIFCIVSTVLSFFVLALKFF